ncbi:MAG: efflux RND transporter periplasmic adaptor subunit [Planctomycetota bacterium]|jgi:HlyD family secretion protein
MKAGRVIGVVVVGAVLSGMAWNWWADQESGSDTPANDAVFTVARGDLAITLTESGELVAKEAQKISSDTDSSGKITFLIEEGKQVEEGELLCKLDPTDLEKKVEQLDLDIVQAEANLSTAKTELEIQQTENTASIEKALIALEKAKKERDRYRDGDAPSERRKLDIAIKEAETAHSRAKKKAEDSQLLFDQEYINRSQLEQDQIDHESAVVRLEGAKLDLKMFETYTLPMSTTDKDVAVTDAQRQKDNAEKRAISTLRQKEVAVEQSTKRLEMLKKRLEETNEEIAKMTITAPSPGIVLYGDPDEPWYRENIRLGGDVWGSMVLFTLPDLRVMQVKLRIHEADINKLDEEQPAKVSMDTYPGVVLDGKVTRIASIASSADRWNSNSEVKKFDVDLTLTHSPELRLRPGVSAKAEIFIDRLEDAVYVPLQCVFLEEGEHWSWVAEADGSSSRVKVEPGQSNDNYIEVLSGLEPGQRVLLYNPKMPASGDAPGAPSPTEDDAAGEADGDDDAAGGADGTTTSS